jgi:hypothetical protein
MDLRLSFRTMAVAVGFAFTALVVAPSITPMISSLRLALAGTPSNRAHGICAARMRILMETADY